MSWQRPERGGPAPAWWPANEAWPPRGRDGDWRHERARFMRRAWVGWWMFFAAMWVVIPLLRSTGILVTSRSGPPLPVVFIGIMVVVFVIATLVFNHRVANPIADLVAAAHRLSNRDYTTRVAEQGPRSVQSVARAFNEMAARLEAEERVRRDLMADIAHELRTPLAVIQGRLEGLLDGVYERDDAHLEGILTDTRVLARLIEDLRTLAHAQSGTLKLHREPINVEDLVRDAGASAAADAGRHGVTVRVDCGETPAIDADPVRLREVLMNLISNAVRHTPRGGEVTLRTRRHAAAIVMEVADTGRGITSDQLPRIFDRFYKGGDSSGSGLGLAIVKSLVDAHGGSIAATSDPGRGTTMTVTLPLSGGGDAG